MAIAIIGGLVVSTALSLFVVPAFYVVADRAKNKLTAWMHREPTPEREPQEERTSIFER